MDSQNNENLTLQTYAQIRKMLLDYELSPGQRLIFVDLAKKLGVSRTTVNNALSMLANQGFMDFIPNQGYRVHEISKNELDSIYEIRIFLELGAVDKVMNYITEQDIHVLKQQKENYEYNALEGVSRKSFIINEQYHFCYIAMANNLYLNDYFRELNQKVYIRHRVEGYEKKRTMEVIKEHDAIFNAIKNGNKRLAKKAIINHILSAKNYIIKHLFT